ncbi:MAG: ROK family transcriptional regulator [Anaerolineaceae bacterium]|nr:ROK family transcriptional regulator [Anaerolineaceae bacterium]
MRKVNTSLVLNSLRLHAPISRAELANATKLNRSTISNIVNVLIDDGLVLEMDTMESKIGRPGIALSLRPDGGAVIGVEIGVGYISVILTDFVANILWREWVDCTTTSPQIEIITRVHDLIDQAISFASSRQLRLLGIGLGVPGLVNTKSGELLFAPNLGWRDVPLRLMFNQRFHIPIYVENEANLGALGEYYFGVGRDVDHFIYISSGVGLGGGIIINGKLFKGGHGFAGEIGHIQRDPQGEMCGCGRRGCWETQVGPRAVLQRVKHAMESEPDQSTGKPVEEDPEKFTFNQVVDFALKGNQICRSAMEEVGRNLGAGIADLVNIFNPQMVVIGGAFSYGREIILPVIERMVASETLPAVRQDLRIIVSEHGADACVLGAIAVVLDDILREMALV